MALDFNFISLILRGVQAVFALIVLGLTGHFANVVGNASENSFLLFVSVWTFFIIIPYLVAAPMYFPAAAHKFALLGAEAVTLIFWFAGFIALAVRIQDCGSTTGGWSGPDLCAELTAATVFGAFEFLLFAATLALTFLHSRGSKAAAPTPVA